jgi:hypothetical protein
MAAVYKLNEDFYDDSFALIAIHSSLEDYTLVYGVNQMLQTSFKRSKNDFELTENSCFPWFEWSNEFQDTYWVLISNLSVKKEKQVNKDLFQNETTFSIPRLIPEHKDVDYFLKIEDDESIDIEKTVKTLMKMPKVITAYALETDKLKSKNNLIF